MNSLEKNKKSCIGKQYKALSVEEYGVNSDSRIISGYAAIWGNKDKAGDILIKGCCAKSINDRGPESNANNKIIYLWMHDMSEPVGKITKLVENEKGLYFEALIDTIPLGDRLITQLKSGTINQFSIGYSYVWDKCYYDDALDAFIVKEIVLYEISAVSIGCNGETEFTGMKSADQLADSVSTLQKDIDSALDGLPFNKISSLKGLFAKTWSLAKVKPDKEVKESLINPLDNKQAGDNLIKGIKFICNKKSNENEEVSGKSGKSA
ncbi:MAG: HK97 family phage prohead protease [Bacteroidales bacterium]|nr:HK97 family phage prohead protease [Bacteroidales bacterium]